MSFSLPTPADFAPVDPTGVNDSSLAFKLAFQANTGVLAIAPGKYKLMQRFIIPYQLEVIGFGKPSLVFAGAINGSGLLWLAGGNRLRGFVIDGTATSGNCTGFYIANDDVILDDVDVINVNNAGVDIYEAQSILIQNGKIQGNKASGIQIRGNQTDKTSSISRTGFITIQGNELSGNKNFGCVVTGGVKGFGFFNNRCQQSGLELLGVTWTNYDSRVAFNHAEGTGDNGISLSGYNISAVGNVAKKNAHNGICLYGSRNTAVANVCHDNNQTPASHFAGLSIDPAFGGEGDNNTAVGNVLTNEVGATQEVGIKVWPAYYPQWTTGTTYVSSACVSNAGNLYRCTVGGVGTVPPSFPSGTVVGSDGVGWAFVDGPLASWQSAGSKLVGNIYVGNSLSPVSNGSPNPIVEYD